jgi:DNA-binding transcriptional ArsR family regulator
VLYEAGVVERQKDGTRVVYAIADPSVFTLCEIVCDGLARHLAEMTALLDEPGARVA